MVGRRTGKSGEMGRIFRNVPLELRGQTGFGNLRVLTDLGLGKSQRVTLQERGRGCG